MMQTDPAHPPLAVPRHARVCRGVSEALSTVECGCPGHELDDGMFLGPEILGFSDDHLAVGAVNRYPFSQERCSVVSTQSAVIGPDGRALLLWTRSADPRDVSGFPLFAREAVPGLFPDSLVVDWIVGRSEAEMVTEILELRHNSSHPDLEG